MKIQWLYYRRWDGQVAGAPYLLFGPWLAIRLWWDRITDPDGFQVTYDG